MEISATRLLRTIENVGRITISQLLNESKFTINVYIPTKDEVGDENLIINSHKQKWYSYTINNTVEDFLKGFKNIDGVKIRLSEKQWKYFLDCEKKLTKKEI